MTPDLTINLLRALFVVFLTCIGLMIGDDMLGSTVAGGMTGASLSLIVVLMDRAAQRHHLACFFLGHARPAHRVPLLEAAPQLKHSRRRRAANAMGLRAARVCHLQLRRDDARDPQQTATSFRHHPYVRFRQATVQDAPLLIDSTSSSMDGSPNCARPVS